jgi:hypothetical protein
VTLEESPEILVVTGGRPAKAVCEKTKSQTIKNFTRPPNR